ncbi:MAG: flagellar protein FlaG [Bacillota bacterium]|nr:flagellar protein FlaG [Bacillota bacterium]
MKIGEIVDSGLRVGSLDAHLPGGHPHQVRPKQEPVESGGREDRASGMSEMKESLREAADKLQEAALIFDYKLHFKIHEDTGRIMVQVIDEETGDLINEVPPEKILNLVAEIWRLVGLLVDKKV